MSLSLNKSDQHNYCNAMSPQTFICIPILTREQKLLHVSNEIRLCEGITWHLITHGATDSHITMQYDEICNPAFEITGKCIHQALLSGCRRMLTSG